MKKQIYILAIAASFFMVACGSSTEGEAEGTTETTEEATEEVVEEAEEASIVGEWKMTDMDMGMEVPAGQEEAFAASIKEAVDATVYTFNEDGTVSLVSNLGEESGTYAVEGSTLTVTTKKAESIEIKELTATVLVMGISEEGMNLTMSFERK
ncbi:MAG: lipocalin family protein [Flavobacteriales bacterium]|nr:lipocalin family protein [Flavobacteriales bacterium]